MNYREFQILTLQTCAREYAKFLPGITSRVDSDALKLTVECSDPTALSVHTHVPVEFISELMKSLTVDLKATTETVRAIFHDLAGSFPIDEPSRWRVDEIEFYTIAVPHINAQVWPDETITINHSLVKHLFVTAGAALLVLMRADTIATDESENVSQVRKAIGIIAFKASSRLPLGSHGGETHALGSAVAELASEIPRLSMNIDRLSEQCLSFLIAHEAGHILLGHAAGELRGMGAAREMDADHFAVHTLVRRWGETEVVHESLWLKIPAMVALLELGQEIDVDSSAAFVRMARTRPNYTDRLLYLMNWFPSGRTEAQILGSWKWISDALRAIAAEMEE